MFKLNGYDYEVLGGQHLEFCYRELQEEFPTEDRYLHLWADIYSNLLTAPQVDEDDYTAAFNPLCSDVIFPTLILGNK